MLMQARSKAMKIKSGRVRYWKFSANKLFSGCDIISGSRAVTNITITIIMEKAIIRYLNFIDVIVKERLFYVNEGE
jgi:hypothetical protein